MGGWAGCTPIHPQEAAGQAGGVARRVGAQRIDSCDHRPGIFLATRVGKERSDCLLRLERGVSSAQKFLHSPNIRAGKVSQQDDFAVEEISHKVGRCKWDQNLGALTPAPSPTVFGGSTPDSESGL